MRVIRNTIDLVLGLSLMLFSKSIADRILKEEQKVQSNKASSSEEDDNIIQRLDCHDNSIISPESNIDKMGGLIQDDSFVSARCGP